MAEVLGECLRGVPAAAGGLQAGQVPERTRLPDDVHSLLAALFVLDPEQRYEGDAEALQRLFGLTQAEAAVMVSVGGGRTPREIAAALGRSYETVRSHLKPSTARPAPARKPTSPA